MMRALVRSASALGATPAARPRLNYCPRGFICSPSSPIRPFLWHPPPRSRASCGLVSRLRLRHHAQTLAALLVRHRAGEVCQLHVCLRCLLLALSAVSPPTMSASDVPHELDGDAHQPHPPQQPTLASHSQSPLTGHDPNFLDHFLPSYEPPHRDSPYPFTPLLFDGAYGAPPTPPPPTNFFDNILNPAGLDHGRYSPFVYHPSPPRHSYTSAQNMPPSTRGNQHGGPRPARLPNGYVDLTAVPDSPPQRRKRESGSPGPSTKRVKRADGSAAKAESAKPPKVEEVDLTGDKSTVQDILQKQREDAIKSQTKPEETHTTFNTFNCVICMDNPTDLSATACGTYGYISRTNEY